MPALVHFRRLDTYLLTRMPEVWLMKLHWVLAASLLLSAVFVLIACCLTVTLSDYPDLNWWRAISRVLSCLLLLAWAWRYTSRVSDVHTSLTLGPAKLFLLHLLCVLAILAPFRVLPMVALWRFERLDFKSIEGDMVEHRKACECLSHMAQLDKDTHKHQSDMVRVGEILCSVWPDGITKFEPDRECSFGPPEKFSEAAMKLRTIHEKYLTYEEMDVRSTLAYWDEEDPPDDRSIFHEAWRRENDLPPYMRAVNNLWYAWCHRVGGGAGFCAELDHDGSVPDVPGITVAVGEGTPTGLSPVSVADVIEHPLLRQTEVILIGILSCLISALLTALRYKRARLLLMAALSPLIALFLMAQFGEVSRALIEISMRPDTMTLTFLSAVAVVAAGRSPIFRSKRYAMDIIAAVGCGLATLLPFLWIAWCVPLDAGHTTVQLLSSLLWYQPTLSDGVDVKELLLTDRLSNTYFGGVPLPWVCLAGTILCTLLAAWVLMGAWRDRDVGPQ